MLGFLSNISNDWYNLGNQIFEFAKSIPLGLKTSKNGQTQQVKKSSQIFFIWELKSSFMKEISPNTKSKKDDPLNPGQYCADWDDRRCVWVIIFSNYQIAFKNTTLIINKNNFSEDVYIFGIWIDWECKE